MRALILTPLLLGLAGCSSGVAYRGAPPAGYTHDQYVCSLTGECLKRAPAQGGDKDFGKDVSSPI